MPKVSQPYGDAANLQLSAVQPYGFSGKERDDSGLLYFEARYYDPLSGRFISPDPLFGEQMDKCLSSVIECNLYQYTGNNPVNHVDPTGEAFFLYPLAVFVVKELAAEAASEATGGLTDFLSVRRMGTKAGKFARDKLSDAVERGNKELAKPKVDLHEQAESARDQLSERLKKSKHPPATVVGAYSPSSGKVTAAANRGGGRGCAEDVCRENLGNPADIKFTTAVRPRNGQDIPVCDVCESKYGRESFPDPKTRYKSEGAKPK